MTVQKAGVAKLEDRRRVEIALGTEEVFNTFGAGQRFRPDKLVLHYKNGRPDMVVLYGPMVRADGHEYLNGARGALTLAPNNVPDWIKDEVTRYQP